MCRETAPDVQRRVRDSRDAASTETLQVQTCCSTDIAKVLRNHLSSAQLLLTFASNNCDEQALARDIHRAASSAEAAKSQILEIPVYNLYRACQRLKQAHDRLTGVQQPSDAANPKKQQPYTLDAMHKHFVGSTGRTFLEPSPEGASANLMIALINK